MGFLIDTNILINNDCLIKLEGNLSLSDISLFERFKNRTIDEKNRIYAETKEMMSKCHIGMFAGKGRYLKIFEFDGCANNKRIDEMCINISCDLISFYIRFIGILLMIIFASKNKIVLYDSQSMISNRDKGEDARFINIISKSHSDFLKKYGHEWAKQIYKQKDNLNCQKYEITFSNVAIDYWNKYIKDEKVKMINIEHFDHIDLIEKNKVSCTLTKLIEYFHFFAEAEKANKEYEVVYLSYLFDIICCGGKIEFNDIVDMNLLLVALKTKNTFVTSEKKILRVIKNFEKNAKLSNAVSKQILLIK